MQLFHYNSEYPDYETASNNTDGLAAVSIFYEISPTDNVAIDPLLTNIEALEKTIFNPSLDEYEYEVSLAEVDTLEVLLPPDGLQLWDNYYYYNGSETLPNNDTDFIGSWDCTEPVLWIVYEKTIPISEAQMNPFRRLLLAANGWNISDTGAPITNGTDPPCVHNFRPVHQLESTAAPVDVPLATGRQLIQIGRKIFDFVTLIFLQHHQKQSFPPGQLPLPGTLFYREFSSILLDALEGSVPLLPIATCNIHILTIKIIGNFMFINTRCCTSNSSLVCRASCSSNAYFFPSS